MPRTPRRFLLLFAVLFWQGGLVSYSAIVVPIARHIFEQHRELQGQVTASVTFWLNVAGVIALLLWAWDLWVTSDSCRRRARLRMLCWTVLLGTLAALLVLHVSLSEQMREPVSTRDSHRFYLTHRLYLWLGMGQSLTALVLLYATLLAWSAVDERPSSSGERGV
jgi:hypothetical protein